MTIVHGTDLGAAIAYAEVLLDIAPEKHRGLAALLGDAAIDSALKAITEAATAVAGFLAVSGDATARLDRLVALTVERHAPLPASPHA